MLTDLKTYELSLTRGYVSSWGVAQAVRELLQNSLDSGSPFVYEFMRQDDQSTTLVLRSEFSTLSPQTLLLGTSSKADNPNAIGSFGEGYKIALLVLTRASMRVEIHNGKVCWTPTFKLNELFGEELLAIEEQPLDRPHSGLTYHIHDLDDSEVTAIVDSCLRMQDNVGAIKRTKYGDIMLDRPGMLYVGGLFVCETDLKYGYNIKPEFLALERDRQTVSNWDLKRQSTNMWIETGEFGVIAQMTSEEIPDLEYLRYSSNVLVKEACYQHFISRHPGKVIAETDKELKALVAQGMTVYVGGSTYYSQVSSAQSYRTTYEKTRIKVAAPQVVLHDWLKANKKDMNRKSIVAFKALIDKAGDWKNA